MQTIGTGYQRAGKNARIQVSGTPLKQRKWDASWSAADISTLNFESSGTIGTTTGGIDEGIAGTISCDWSMAGDWDAHANPLDPANPPGIYPRDDLPQLRQICNVTDAIFWSFPYARCRSAKNSAEASSGAVAFEGSGKNQGIFAPPTGSV
jgi:hypothetical protein